MQALILVGGEGTRLRPLTTTIPKPVVPLAGKPFIGYMLEWLRSHGVERVVMSCGFRAAGVREVLGEGGDFGVQLTWVEEPEPLGTGGAVKYAEDLLDERFFMLNGDVLTDLDLSAQLDQHERTGARGTLALIGVEDPTAYGLVRLHEDNSVRGFLEKPRPEEIDTNLISAGAYVLEREVLGMLERGRNASIERDVFPALVGEGLYGFPGDGYWMDIGTPDRYLQATFDILERNVRTTVGERLDDNYVFVDPSTSADGQIAPPAYVGRDCELDGAARVGSLAVLGDGVAVAARSSVESAVVLDGARIGSDCSLRYCIVGPGVTIGEGSHVGGGAVLGEGVRIGAHNVLAHGARLFPGVELPDGAIKF